MFQCYLNNVVVKVKTKYHKDVANMVKRATLNPGSQINPCDFVSITGEVVSIPKYFSNREDYKGYTTNDIYPGDTAIFRYDVICDIHQTEPDADPIYKNMVWFKGQEYFLADIQKVFGVIRAGEIIMTNGYCMIEKMSAPSALILPHHLKKVIQTASATLMGIGRQLSHLKPVSAEPGDTVYYNPLKVQEYEISGKKFGILRQKDISAKKIASFEELQDFKNLSAS